MFPTQTRLEYCDTCREGATYVGYDLSPTFCPICSKSRTVFHDFHGKVDQKDYDKKVNILRKVLGKEPLNMNDDDHEDMEESDYNPLRELISQKQDEVDDLTDKVSDLTAQVNELHLENQQLQLEKERLEDAVNDIQLALRAL